MMHRLQWIHDRLASAFSSEKLSSAEQRKRARDYPEETYYMGTRVWCTLNSAEVMLMQREIAAQIREDERE